ncbi:Pgd1p NDAI_0D03680 [Naumovozyma dairenensis CBS 421]|uniref:Uncharacterized protein n=1 Tax=Naumovozyma dairenensis (strain ATCC 10597 / BCRC 20456 / CBS 421 / NBRC 0211 / NRRL Y-12639) TaxID=1071378 RepID=G0WA71_NAUDC|nr:hypothetical protein NDAI_0D03680 [Naumovozyma dairenensis CBS 421]CCD24682.1 hypothetical protein NDAI_0D03680 [Naumovozyma dairenensis CBS 421]
MQTSSESELSKLLTPKLTLDQLEDRLAGDIDNLDTTDLSDDSLPKQVIANSLIETEKSILPLRLVFNKLIQTMATLDTMPEKSQQEMFLSIRNQLLDLYTKIQEISTDFQHLQPLFGTIEEYSEKNNTKKFHMLETLKPIVEPAPATAKATKGDASHSKKKSVAGTPGSVGNTPVGTTPGSSTGTVAANVPANINANTTNTSTTSAASTTQTTSSTAKKPRKPRQNKKAAAKAQQQQQQQLLQQQQQQQIPKQQGIATNPMMNMNAMNATPMMNSVSPSNVMGTPLNNGISPMGAVMAGGFYSQPPGSQSQQFDQQMNNGDHNTNNNNFQNMNNITPANILSMNTVGDPQSRMASSSQQYPTNNNNNNTLDLNNLDLSSLNMDFL